MKQQRDNAQEVGDKVPCGRQSIEPSRTKYKLRSTTGLLFLETHMNNQFANKPEGLRHFRDHCWKALDEENPDLSGPFLFRHYFESYTE